MTDIMEASARFHSDIATASLELDMLKEHRFVEEVAEILVEAGELEDCVRCSYRAHGLKIDGYCYDAEFGILHLLVAHWIDEVDPSNAKITDSMLDPIFKRCINFFTKSKRGLHQQIEIANEAHDLSLLIHESSDDIVAIRIYLITDGLAPKRPADIVELDGVEITRMIWDLERIMQFIETGEREPIIIDFDENGGCIPCLRQANDEARYTTYLSYIPGYTLASMYSRWGTRLLDMNVRVFLSARGKVNKGLRNTIVNEPEMFCAYNNGITVFAREVECVTNGDGSMSIRKASDMQIVNGGQTVASLYHASKKQKAELDDISVPMKLVVINDKEDIDILVPRISEYSNTQNRVSSADLSANDPPHPELHEISKRMRAPDPTGGSRQTYWFYEKARGSYEETKRLEARTPAQRKAFEALYPKRQRFDKSIFGKAWNTYLRKPHIVSLGAQKNFAHFNLWLREQEIDDYSEFFMKTVALVMLWKEAERIVRRQPFQGYRHNIVTYSLAWIHELSGVKIDLDRLWKEQAVHDKILETIEDICHIVNAHIRETDRNVTEWCKKEECWTGLLERGYQLPSGIDDTYIDPAKQGHDYDPRIRAEVEIIEFCKEKGTDAWWKLARWLKERRFLSSKARSQCGTMGRTLQKGKEPSYYLSKACKKAWHDAEIRGWEI